MKYPTLNKIKIPLILMTASIIMVSADFLLNGFIGRFVNIFFPCSYPAGTMNSAPCYLGYDIAAILILLGIFVLSFLSMIIIIITSHKKNKDL